MSEDLHSCESGMWPSATETVWLETGLLILHGKGGGRLWDWSDTVLKGFLQFILVLQALQPLHTECYIFIWCWCWIMNSVSEILTICQIQADNTWYSRKERKKKRERRIYSCK